MRRAITGFRQDDQGEWAAQLACLHGQHIRHRPPFQLAPWVLDDAERAARVGSDLECPLCDRAELPGDLTATRTSDTWDQDTLPAALTRSHRVPAGTWGVLHVEQGRLRFVAATDPPLDVVVEPGAPQSIPPEVEHHVEPLGPVRFFLEFLTRL